MENENKINTLGTEGSENIEILYMNKQNLLESGNSLIIIIMYFHGNGTLLTCSGHISAVYQFFVVFVEFLFFYCIF
jgi:hypothetical protein